MGFFNKLKEKFKKKDKSISTYDSGLKESREAFTNKLNKLSKKYKKVNEEYFEEVEEILLSADCGVSFTYDIIEKLVDKSKKEKIDDSASLNEALFSLLFDSYLNNEENLINDLEFKNKPEIILVCGVNGVGKTTSIAKLAYRYISMNKKVLLVAADTFRAGAKEQLTYWSERINADIVAGKENADPASVVYDGLKKAKENDYDLIIIDTAGRLQNKVNLMNELKKINKIIEKENYTLDESFLIIDATTGQNGILQAKAFKEIMPLSGIILTKMDGTSKGGIIFTIKNELNIPVRFIGLGEKMEDLEVFDINKYIYGLINIDE